MCTAANTVSHEVCGGVGTLGVGKEGAGESLQGALCMVSP